MTPRLSMLPALATLILVFSSGCVTRDRASLSVVPPAPAPFAAGPTFPVDPAPAAFENAAPVEFIPADLEPVEMQATQPLATTPAPVVRDAPPAQASGQRYVVRKGDSLWTIARRHYGSGAQWQKIANANPHLQNPHRLTVGQELILP